MVLMLISFLLPVISAVEFDMKSNFGKGETLIAKISGNFVEPPLKENIFFYRGHVQVPMEFDLGKIDGDYYIYAQLPENSEDYSIEMQKVKYYSGTKIVDDNIIKNFTISNATADFSIEPGFIITNKDFSIELQNLQESKITIYLNSQTISGSSKGFFSSLFGTKEIQNNSDTSFTLKSGEIKSVNFETASITENSLKTIKFNSENLVYEIPVYVIKNTSEPTQIGEFRIEPSRINLSLATDSETTRFFYIHNTGKEIINNITINLSESLEPYCTILENEIEKLDVNESAKIEIEISSDSEEQIIEGQLKVKAEPELSAYSSLTFNFIKDFVPSNENEIYVPETTETCVELNGTICGETQECDSDEVFAKDATCCLSNCTDESTNNSTGKIIGGAIIGIVLIFIIWFYKKKYKGTEKRKVDFLGIGEGKKE